MKKTLLAALAASASLATLAATHTEVTKVPRLPFMRGMGFDGYYEGRNRTWMTQPGVYSGLVAKGFDHVRLPVDFRDYATYDSGTGKATLKETTLSWFSTGPGFSTFDTVITNAINAGLYITLDFHGWFDINVTNQAQRAQFKALWRAVAERYKDYPNKLNFELANEPRAPVGHSSHLNSLQKETVAIIRETNPTRLILYAVPDANQPWALTQCQDPPKTSWVSLPANDNNIALVIHSYNPGYFTHQGESWNAGSSTTNVPFSAKYRRELQQDLDWCKAYMDLTGNKIDINEFNASHAIATHSDVTDYLSMVTRFCESNKVPWAPWIYYANGSGFDCFSGYGANASMIDYVEAGLFPDLNTTDKFSTNNYPHAIDITFSGYSGSSALANFPVLVKLSESLTGFHYSDFTRADGFDLCFTDANGKLLAHEIDTWNPNGVSTVWVKVPSLTASTKIVARYGCAKPIVPKVESVWDENYVGVWHMGEQKLPLADSSNVSRDVTSADGTGIGYGSAGIAGGAVDFGAAGSSRCVNMDDHKELDGFKKLTVEAWTKQDAHATNAGIVSKRKGAGSQATFYMFDNGSGTTMSYSTNGSAVVSSGIYLTPTMGQWNHQVYSIDTTATASNSKAYLNGVNKGTKDVTLTGGLFAGASELHVGNLQDGNAANFPGQIDEVRISKCVRSADWIKASHDTVAKADFATYAVDGVASPDGPEEPVLPPVEYGPLATNQYAKSMNVLFAGAPNNATLTNFPVLVKLSTAINGFSYSDFQLANGGDLRFADSTGKLLPHEIDTWNSNGVSTVWVKVPSLTKDTAITACYGCAEPPDVAAKDVWDENYVGVWHLGESALPMKESSGMSSDFATKGGTVAYGAEGAVGGAVDFSQATTKNYLMAADDDDLDGFADFTVEAWTRQDAFRTDGNYAGMLSKRNSYYNQESYFFYQNNTSGNTKPVFSFNTNSTSSARATVTAGVLPETGRWTHNAFTRDSGTGGVVLYLDGTSRGTGTSGKENVFAGSAPLHIGCDPAQQSFPGKIDEVRISKVARSAAWIKATHDTIADDAFATYAVEGAGPVEPGRILYITVAAGETNTLDSVLVTSYITNIVKQGSGTLVASAIPSYAHLITVESGVWRGGASAGDFGAEGAVIEVEDGASLELVGANGACPVANALSGRTINLCGAKCATASGKIQIFGNGSATIAFGEDVSINLKDADSLIYVSNAKWDTCNFKSGAVDLGGKTLTIQASRQIQMGLAFSNGGAVVLKGTALYVEWNGMCPSFSGTGVFQGDSPMNIKKKIDAPGWTLKTSHQLCGNVNAMPTKTEFPGWEGPVEFSWNSVQVANYAGASVGTSNTVFNLKGAVSGSGTLRIGPGWVNLHSADNTYRGAVYVNGQAVGSGATILPGGGGIGLWNGAACFPDASSVTFTNTARLAFMDLTKCTVGTNVFFDAKAGEVQSVSGGGMDQRPAIGRFTKTGAGLLEFSSTAAVAEGRVLAGTLKVTHKDVEGASLAALTARQPQFAKLEFASGTLFDLSDNTAVKVDDLVGATTVTNAGIFGVMENWKLATPGDVLTLKGENASYGEQSIAGMLVFAEGATFTVADEAAFSNAVVAAGADGLVVARANWVFGDSELVNGTKVVLPQPSAGMAHRWEMAVGDGGTTLRLRFASSSGYAAWMATKGISGAPAEKTNGIENGVRYAFDIDPAASDVDTPVIKIVRDANGNPCVEARALATGRDDVTFGILATPDLTDWGGATLVPMAKSAADGLWKPTASETPGYVFPSQMFFKYTIDIQ